MTYTIRAFTEADAPQMVAIRNLPGVRWGTLSTPFESVERWRQIRAAGANPGTHLCACVGDGLVGNAALWRARPARQNHVASLGIQVHDDWQGKGVGTALFAALTDLADNWLGLRRLELGVYTDNPGAIALYQKFGFAIESTARADAFRDGAYVDAHMMGRLRGHLPADTSAPPVPSPRAPAAPFTLRAAEPGDLGDITAMMNLPGVRHGTLRLPFCTEEDNRAYAVPTDPNAKSLVAVVEGRAVGIGMLIPAKGRRAHVGDLALLAVHDAYQGHGIGQALMSALLDIADNWLNLKRVELSVFADNAQAVAVYERFGFVREGVKRADAFRNGGFADAYAMARLR